MGRFLFFAYGIIVQIISQIPTNLKKGIDIFPARWYYHFCVMRKCRNWQTSKTKDLVIAISCGFKSHLPHWKTSVFTGVFIFVLHIMLHFCETTLA